MKRRYVCEVPGCGRFGHRRGPTTKKRQCQGHWRREAGLIDANKPLAKVSKNGTHCAVAGCDRKPRAKGLCIGHWTRQYKGYSDPGVPLRENGRKLDRIVSVRLPDFALAALNRRHETTKVPVSSLARALIERWAMTDGAEMKPVLNARRTDIAWARGDSEMNRDH